MMKKNSKQKEKQVTQSGWMVTYSDCYFNQELNAFLVKPDDASYFEDEDSAKSARDELKHKYDISARVIHFKE
jgi:hypothetical protein